MRTSSWPLLETREKGRTLFCPTVNTGQPGLYFAAEKVATHHGNGQRAREGTYWKAGPLRVYFDRNRQRGYEVLPTSLRSRSTQMNLIDVTKSFRWLLPTLVLICALCSAAQSPGGAVPKVQFAETIARIRTGETSTTRTNNAANLEAFTETIDPKKVNDATLGEMVSLLNTDDDGVRGWVAAALGNLGPRARIAVPTLLDLLRKVDCLEGDLTSAGAIRLALTRIGETPPPQPICFPKWPSSRR
jgi:hypothetical protein